MPPTRRRAPSIEALEPRLLFSADPTGAADAVAAAWVASIPSEAIAWQGRPAAEGDIGADTEAASHGGAVTAARELALVDARVPDADRLLAELHGQRDAGRPIDVLVVGEGDDAIAALDAALSGAQGTYRAVHLFGHGEPGSMQLGDGALDLATLRARAGEVAGWSLGLAEGADLLLWGCDAGAGPDGAALLDALSALTGADVAASTDATGGLAAGGDWVLEAARGSIETTAPIGEALRAGFAGRLGLVPISNEVAVATAQTPQETSGSTSTAGRQVAASAAGTVLVWVATDGERILAQRYAADGSLRGAVLTIDADTRGPRMPSVAMDDAGNILVAWSIDGQARACYARATALAAGVTNFDGTSFKVNSGDGVARTPGQVSVDLSLDGLRGVVVWSEDDGTARDISAQRLSISAGSGATLNGSKIQITESQGLWDGHPDAGIDNDGAIIVVLASTPGSFETDSGIFSFRVAAGSGTATPGPSTYGDRVSDTVLPNNAVQVTPAFALGENGSGLAVWVDTRSGTSLWTRVIGPTGPTGPLVQIPTDPGHVVGRPSVAAVAGGGWVVVWETTSSDGSGIRAIQVDAGGQPVTGGAFHVDTTLAGDQRAPSVAVAGNRVVIAWTGPGGGQGGASALVMRSYDLGGVLSIGPVSPVNVLENATAATTVVLQATVGGNPAAGVTWSLLAPGVPAGLVGIDPSTGVLTVAAGLDFEQLTGGTSLGGGQRSYAIDVLATLGGSALQTSTTVQVNVGNVHEMPSLQAPTALAAFEDEPRELSAAGGSAVSIEADAAATRLDLVLSVDRGTLTLGAFAGLDFSGGSDGTNDATIRFGGSPAAVAAALASLTFRPEANASGAATITVTVSDPGLVGPASQSTIALTIAADNDAPVAGPVAKPVSVEAGGLAAVAAAALAATDVDDGPERIVYELAEASPFGDLLFDDVAMEVGHRFTQADVDLGRVSFAAREVGTATVSLLLADAGGAMAGTTTLTFEVKARPAAPVPAADVPAPAAEAPVQAVTLVAAVAAAPRAAAAAPTFVMSRAAPSFASLSSAAQADGADSGSTRASAAQSSQQASDGGAAAAASPGLSAGPASAQPASVTVRVGSGGTGAGAAAGVPGAVAVPVAAAAVGSAQSGASAAAGLQAVASVAASAGAQGSSAAGAQLAWHGVASDTASDEPGAAGSAAGAGSSPGSGGAGGWSRARSGAGSATALSIDAWSPAVALRQADFRAELAQTREEAVARFDTDRAIVASSVAISTSLSIGYVVWLARGGVLLTSLLASLPAWRSIDPLPVLARVDARGRDDGDEDDSLRGLLQRAADEQAERVAEAEALADRAALPAGRLAQEMT